MKRILAVFLSLLLVLLPIDVFSAEKGKENTDVPDSDTVAEITGTVIQYDFEDDLEYLHPDGEYGTDWKDGYYKSDGTWVNHNVHGYKLPKEKVIGRYFMTNCSRYEYNTFLSLRNSDGRSVSSASITKNCEYYSVDIDGKIYYYCIFTIPDNIDYDYIYWGRQTAAKGMCTWLRNLTSPDLPAFFPADGHIEVIFENGKITGWDKTQLDSVKTDTVYNINSAEYEEKKDFCCSDFIYFPKGTIIDCRNSGNNCFGIKGFDEKGIIDTGLVKDFYYVFDADAVACIEYSVSRTLWDDANFTPEITDEEIMNFIHITSPEDDANNPWKGKLWYAFGTSITDSGTEKAVAKLPHDAEFSVSVNTYVYRNKINTKFYEENTFTFSSGKWLFNGAVVDPVEYGITVTGSPSENDSMTVSISYQTDAPGNKHSSITGDGARSGKYSIYLEQLSGLIRVNRAIGSGGIMPDRSHHGNVLNNILNCPANADLVTLELLPNDDYRTNLGEIGDKVTIDENGNVSGGSFIACLSYALDYLVGNTNARIVFIAATVQYTAPGYSTTSKDKNYNIEHKGAIDNATHKSYRNAVEKVKELCSLYGVEVIDAEAEVPLWEDRMCKYTYADGIHLNYFGGEMVADYIWNHLKNIQPVDNTVKTLVVNEGDEVCIKLRAEGNVTFECDESVFINPVFVRNDKEYIENGVVTTVKEGKVSFTVGNNPALLQRGKSISIIDDTGEIYRIRVFAKTADEAYIPLPGDVDGDNTLTSSDARLALRASVGLKGDNDIYGNILDFTDIKTPEFYAADFNNDEMITSADARSILRVSVGLEP